VMRVKEKTTGTMFAMKCIPKAEVKMYEALAIREEVYFLKEVKGYSSRFFLVTEMCSMDLMKYILKFKTFIDDDFSFVVNELFDAVGYLHGRKILHGDIKPENALVNINSKKGSLPSSLATWVSYGEDPRQRLGYNRRRSIKMTHPFFLECGNVKKVVMEKILKPAKAVFMPWLRNMEGFDYDCKVEDDATLPQAKIRSNFYRKGRLQEGDFERFLQNMEHRKATVHVAENVVSNIMDAQCWEDFFVNPTWNQSPLLPLTSYGIMESLDFADENRKMDDEIADDVEDWNAYFVDIVWNDFSPPPFLF
ncbi:kinase-like domain-containing protein, partial [Chytridium lagenaria]